MIRDFLQRSLLQPVPGLEVEPGDLHRAGGADDQDTRGVQGRPHRG